ncbi:MAG: hypothetical protein [Olavius algarvensis Delta 4 endosymbiont]|nr:MAG: hypothetical protein [Olavius algarvensis Delta 4 endosymbiont]
MVSYFPGIYKLTFCPVSTIFGLISQTVCFIFTTVSIG